MLDFKTLLAPVTPEQPSGSLLEYDPAFLALFETAKGKPEQRMGESVIPAEPPNWRKVESGAVALLAQTKDLRLAILLVKARLHEGSAAGLFEGLAFTRALLETHWDTIHPQLDPEDDNDPVMRINALAELADPDTVLTAFRDAEVVSARGVGRVRVRDLETPTGGDRGPAARVEQDAEKAAGIEAVLSACDRTALAKTAEGAAGALADLLAIDAFVREKVGGDHGPELSGLVALVRLVSGALSEWVGKGGAKAAEERPQSEPVERGTPPRADQPGATETAGPFVGAIASQSDVLRALDAICAYYERFEPSSPIPLLIKRSKRLVNMSFIDIVRELMPEAVPQVETLRGKHE